jgi:hypothetical protein
MAALVNDRRWTPAQIAALAFGIWWIGNGIAVFASEPSGATLATDSAVRTFGLSIAVNGWHGIFHLFTGLAGVAVCRWPGGARAYVLLMAVLYLSAALCSLFTGATVFGVIHVDDLGSADHAVEGAAMVAVWLASREEAQKPTSQSAQSREAARL